QGTIPVIKTTFQGGGLTYFPQQTIPTYNGKSLSDSRLPLDIIREAGPVVPLFFGPELGLSPQTPPQTASLHPLLKMSRPALLPSLVKNDWIGHGIPKVCHQPRPILPMR